MKRYLALSLVLAATLVGAASAPRPIVRPAGFKAELLGQSVFPPTKTLAHGEALLRLDSASDDLSFTISLVNTENVTKVHLHGGAKVDSLGPLLATLYNGPAHPGHFDGVLAKGKITSSDFKGPLIDQPMSALLELLGDETVYVDVHTEQNPDAELRGQVLRLPLQQQPK